MKPAPAAWRHWKRAQRPIVLEPGQAANDRRFSGRMDWRTLAVITALLVVGLLWALVSSRPHAGALTDYTHRATAELACWLETPAAPGSLSRPRSTSCWR
jgi:hypothetical protein